MGSYGNTLFAALLSARAQDRARKDMERQRAVEQSRYEDSRNDQLYNQMLAREASIEKAKNAEFERHFKVASLLGENASRRGEAMPTNFATPALMEAAQVGYGTGEAALDLEERKRKQEILLRQMQEQAALGRAGVQQRGAGERQESRNAAALHRALMTQRPERYSAPDDPLREYQRRGIAELVPGASGDMYSRNPLHVAGEGGSNPNLALKLWDRFERHPVVKETQQMQSQYALMETATPGDGDIALLMSWARMIEPGARAVTDKDFTNVAMGSSWADRIKSAVAYYVANNGRLSPELRNSIKSEAKVRMNTQIQRYRVVERQARAQAERYNVNPEDVTWQYEFSGDPSAGHPTTMGDRQPKDMTDEEIEAEQLRRGY